VFTKLYLQLHDSKASFIQRVKPNIAKISVDIEKAEALKKLYHELRVNPIFFGWHLRPMLFESSVEMVKAICKCVEDPEYHEHVDEIVHLHRDLRISGKEVDDFESLSLRMSSAEGTFVVKFKEVIAQFKMQLLTDE